MVGVIPLFTSIILSDHVLDNPPGFRRRMEWFMEHRSERLKNITFMQRAAAADETRPAPGLRLLAIPTRERMERMLKYLLDETEFLSPCGIRSMSQIHETQPFIFYVDGHQHRVNYIPGDSDSSMFGGNSNWHGPVWFLPDDDGKRPCHGEAPRFQGDAHWKDLLLFHEYFHGETGQGLGATHQTGWTALVAKLIGKRHRRNAETAGRAAAAASAEL